MPFRSVLSRSNVLSLAMVGLAGIITWYGLSGTGNTGPAENHSTVPADAAMVASPPPAAPPAEPGDEQVNSGLPTRVVIPTAGVDAPIEGVGVVTEGGKPAWETAQRAVGHHLGSALPGNPGNLVLTGHVSVAAQDAVPYFSSLTDVQVGDTVEVHSGQAVHRYLIEDIQQVSPESTGVLRSDHRSRVTLITCTPDLQDRIVVVGSLIA